MPFALSPQQTAIVDWTVNGSGSAFCRARAGTGKTTTLIEMLVSTTGSVALCAYNKKIAVEIEQKLADKANPKHKDYDPRFIGLSNRVRVGTFHKFGLAAVSRAYPGVKVDEKAKSKEIITLLSARCEGGVMSQGLDGFVLKLVSLAKQRAIGLFGAIDDKSLWYDIVDHFDLAYEIEDPEMIEQGVELAIEGLKLSTAMANRLIDFDDMIYIPVVKGMKLWENDWVLVDEAQDTNPARRALARKMLKRNGRAVFVGDENQSIYGFTGADADAIQQIMRDFKCATLPLTVTYRCPKAVVAIAQGIVPDIQAHASAPEGTVRSIEGLEKVVDLGATDAVLCRNTKPLVETAYALIRRGIACHVEGKDIGVGLLKLANKYSVRSLDDLRDKLETFLERETQKLIAKGRETMAEALADRIETLFVLMDGCPDVNCLRQKIATMFLDGDKEAKPTLTLSTVHKSKGREWNRVFILGYDTLMPSKWARQAWQLEQEENLKYVAVSRAKSELVFVPAPVSTPKG